LNKHSRRHRMNSKSSLLLIIVSILFCSLTFTFIPFYSAFANERCLDAAKSLESHLQSEEVNHSIQVAKDVLKENGLSDKWIWLMLAESGSTSTRAISSKGAIGAWQLMKATSKHYGCSNPHDIECSSNAASKYIKHLLKMFNNDIKKTIYGYNMGGRNYKRIGRPTKQAEGLAFTVLCGMKYGNLKLNSNGVGHD